MVSLTELEQEVHQDELALKLSRLEGAVESTQENINQLAATTEKQIANLAKSFDKQLSGFVEATQNSHAQLVASVDKLASRQHELTKTPWANIIAFAGLIVTVISLVGVGFVLNPLKVVADELSLVERRIETHTQDGHPQAVRELVNALNDETEMVLGTYQKKFDRIEAWIERWAIERLPAAAAQETMLEDLRETQAMVVKRIATLSENEFKHGERLHAIERDLYQNISYKSGRPVGTTD